MNTVIVFIQFNLYIKVLIQVLSWTTVSFKRLVLPLHNKVMFCIVSCCSCCHSSEDRELLKGETEVEGEKEQCGKREKPLVRPEEIPPVPENRFLLRRDLPSQEDKIEMLVWVCALFIVIIVYLCHVVGVYFYLFFYFSRVEKEETALSTDQKPAVSKSGRKIKGRGTMVCSPQLKGSQPEVQEHSGWHTIILGVLQEDCFTFSFS